MQLNHSKCYCQRPIDKSCLRTCRCSHPLTLTLTLTLNLTMALTLTLTMTLTLTLTLANHAPPSQPLTDRW